MNRNADGATLIGDRARNCLSDPPGGIRAEFKSATVFKFVDRSHQAGIPLLNQIQEA
jgi:hypothetical protein